ncbi:MAG: shikimate kinase [Eubacteriales bacterium]
MILYGLCGKTLKHSYSEIIHRLLGNTAYQLINMSLDEFYAFMRQREFRAVNVTIPYKTDALKCCDEVAPEAARIGSVNTVVNRGGRLYGYNTDYFGFCYMLDSAGIDVSGKKALILGTGGTSLTARHVIADRGAREIVIVARSGEVNYGNLYQHADADLIVNTTPVGMFPANGDSLVDLDRFPALCGAVDVIYNPLKTKFISDALARGIPAVSGLSMLVAQAVAAHELFFDAPFADRDAVIRDILAACTAKVCNVVLVGMPGSGKTTVGKLLAEKTGMPFYDSDVYLEESCGRKIPDIIAQDGEPAFRAAETEVLAQLTKISGCIIATGGGAVLAPYNRYLLRQNGICIYIERDIEKLATDGRPLSAGGTDRLRALFAKRDPLYREVADFCVPTNEDPASCAAAVLEKTGLANEAFLCSHTI